MVTVELVNDNDWDQYKGHFTPTDSSAEAESSAAHAAPEHAQPEPPEVAPGPPEPPSERAANESGAHWSSEAEPAVPPLPPALPVAAGELHAAGHTQSAAEPGSFPPPPAPPAPVPYNAGPSPEFTAQQYPPGSQAPAWGGQFGPSGQLQPMPHFQDHGGVNTSSAPAPRPPQLREQPPHHQGPQQHYPAPPSPSGAPYAPQDPFQPNQPYGQQPQQSNQAYGAQPTHQPYPSAPQGQPGPAQYGNQPPYQGAVQSNPGLHGFKDPSEFMNRVSSAVLTPPPDPRPERGWRKMIDRSTGGKVNPGLSKDEEQLRKHRQVITGTLRGDCYRIAVFGGKGGTGNSTVATLLASIMAEFRAEDRVVALDADPSFGKLANRIDAEAPNTYWELLAERQAQRLHKFNDVKAFLGSNPNTGLWVLRNEWRPDYRVKYRRVISPEIYLQAESILDTYMSIAITDCGKVLEHPVMDAILPRANAAVIVGALEQGAGEATAQTLWQLHAMGFNRLSQNSVVVLNDPRGRATKPHRDSLLRDFKTHVDAPTILLPYDAHLSGGGVIDTKKGISKETRRITIEIAEKLASKFGTTTLGQGPA